MNGWHNRGSMGPSCAVADYKPSASRSGPLPQGTHGQRRNLARDLKMPVEQVRDLPSTAPAPMANGSDDASPPMWCSSRARSAARSQWMREDELGWDLESAAALDLRAALDASGNIAAWETEAWLPETPTVSRPLEGFYERDPAAGARRWRRSG
jgi:hypothetical protein